MGWPFADYKSPEDRPYFERLDDLSGDLADQLKHIKEAANTAPALQPSIESRPIDVLPVRDETIEEHDTEAPAHPGKTGSLYPNPFTQILAIRDPYLFIGRAAELRLQQNRLRGGSVALLGEPKIGKSSLLWQLTHSEGYSGLSVTGNTFVGRRGALRQIEIRWATGKLLPTLILLQRLCWELVNRWNECFLKQIDGG